MRMGRSIVVGSDTGRQELTNALREYFRAGSQRMADLSDGVRERAGSPTGSRGVGVGVGVLRGRKIDRLDEVYRLLAAVYS